MDLGRPSKRRRTASSNSIPTPPTSGFDLDCKLLDHASHVLSTQAAALSHVTRLYQTDPTARQGLVNAVNAVVQAQHSHGKLIVCGVGKSAYIGMKLVATCKSLGVSASFMHAGEATHGDLGDVRENDVILFVSFSGKTPELLNLLPHIPESTRIMAMTSHLKPEDCLLFTHRPNGILLPAPIHEREEDSFGVCAPTTSTTVALAVADMLALTITDQLYQEQKKQIFKRNHPGGAIGMNHKEVEELKKDGVDFSVLELPSPSISAEDEQG